MLPTSDWPISSTNEDDRPPSTPNSISSEVILPKATEENFPILPFMTSPEGKRYSLSGGIRAEITADSDDESAVPLDADSDSGMLQP